MANRKDVGKVEQTARQVATNARLAWRLFWDQRVPGLAKLLPLLGLSYVILPFDFWPDVVIGVGQLDDLAVLALTIKLFIAVCPPLVVQEITEALAVEGNKDGGEEKRKRGNPGHGKDDVVDAKYRVVS